MAPITHQVRGEAEADNRQHAWRDSDPRGEREHREFLGQAAGLGHRRDAQLLPGRGAEYASITTNEFLPAFKKAGVADSWMFAANFGAPVAQRTVVTPIAGWAELHQPNPLIRALGAEAAQKLNQKRAALTTSTETVVMRYVPELS